MTNVGFRINLTREAKARWYSANNGPTIREVNVLDIKGVPGTGRGTWTPLRQPDLNMEFTDARCCGFKELYCTNWLGSVWDEIQADPTWAYRFWVEVMTRLGGGLTGLAMIARSSRNPATVGSTDWALPTNAGIVARGVAGNPVNYPVFTSRPGSAAHGIEKVFLGKNQHMGTTMMLHLVEMGRRWGLLNWSPAPAYHNKNSGNTLFPVFISPAAVNNVQKTANFTKPFNEAVNVQTVVEALRAEVANERSEIRRKIDWGIERRSPDRGGWGGASAGVPDWLRIHLPLDLPKRYLGSSPYLKSVNKVIPKDKVIKLLQKGGK